MNLITALDARNAVVHEKMKATLICNLATFLLCCSTFAIEGKVVAVTDGDTIKVLTADKTQIKIRLYGIDAPEKKQAYGTFCFAPEL